MDVTKTPLLGIEGFRLNFLSVYCFASMLHAQTSSKIQRLQVVVDLV